MNGPGSLQSAGGGMADADSPSGLGPRSSSPARVAALSPPPLPINIGGDRWQGPPGLRSTSMDNNTENNNKVT